jgi:hypothetical protein
MNAAKNVTANFITTNVNFLLTLSKSGAGGGTITSNPTGINCGATCSFSYTNNTSVTLTAVSAVGSIFTGWSGDCTGSTETCTISTNAAKNVLANFNLLVFVETLDTSGGLNRRYPGHGVTKLEMAP